MPVPSLPASSTQTGNCSLKLDFQVQIVREGKGEAGIKLYVVSLGAKGGVSSAQTHTVSVSLAPQAWSGERWVDVMVGQDVAARPE
jgi:hypothetical protein